MLSTDPAAVSRGRLRQLRGLLGYEEQHQQCRDVHDAKLLRVSDRVIDCATGFECLI